MSSMMAPAANESRLAMLIAQINGIVRGLPRMLMLRFTGEKLA